jgi:hypothetical protein
LWNITGGTIQAVGATTARKTPICLNAPDPRNGTQLQIWKCDGRNSQRWVFTSYKPNTATPVAGSGSGSGTGTGSGSGSGSGTTTTTSTNVVTTGQPEIYSGLKGYCLDDLKSGQANLNVVDIYKCNGTSAQQWGFSTQQLMIHGKCADVYRQGKTAGTVVDLYACNGGANQKWDYVNNNFISHQSKLCLNAPGPRAGGDPYNGLQLQIQKCDGRTSEKWFFGHYPQNAPVATSGNGSGSGSGSGTGSATNEFPGVPQTPCDPATNPFCPPSSDSSGTPVIDPNGTPVTSTTVSQCPPVTNGVRTTAIFCSNPK